MFWIGFTDERLEYPYDNTSIPAAPGCLVLGSGTIEDFVANLGIWGKQDYEWHWKRELQAVLEAQPKGALVVSYDDPKAAWNMEIWKIYRGSGVIHFQNQLLAYETLPVGFEISELSRYVDDRKVTSEDGQRLSEWDVAFCDVEIFLSGGCANSS